MCALPPAHPFFAARLDPLFAALAPTNRWNVDLLSSSISCSGHFLTLRSGSVVAPQVFDYEVLAKVMAMEPEAEEEETTPTDFGEAAEVSV